MSELNPRLVQGHFELEELDASQFVGKIAFPTVRKYPPAELESMLKQGIDLHQRGLTKDAMEIYREVLLHDPDNKKCLYFAGIALSQQNGEEAKVLAIMEKAIEAMPNVPEAHYNLGILLHRMGKETEAKERFLYAAAMLDSLIEAKVSLGGAYLNEGDRVRGRRWLINACKTETPSLDSRYSRGFAKLTLGDYIGGLADYDFRWKTGAFLAENRRNFGKAKHWNGKPIPGRTLYVHTEQGAGDVIMFSRFLERVHERSQAGMIVLEVGDTLVDLLAQVRGVDYVIASNTPIPEECGGKIDYYLPMMSILRQTGFVKLEHTRIPYGGAGWLRPVADQLVALPPDPNGLGPNALRVGISWAGSKAHKNDRYRSILWPQFRDAVLAHPDVAGKNIVFYSFQVGDRARDVDDGTPPNLVDLTPAIKTFGHTLHAATQMDLMLCVDTATIHAAGAAVDGPDIVTLIPAAPDWRWGLEGDRTPWYSRMQLVRQDHCADWATPLDRARSLLLDRYGG